MSDLDTVRARYAGRALDEWDRLQATPITRTEYLITRHSLDRYLPDMGTLLDAGSGPGRYAVYLARRGYRVVMFDLVREMLCLGRQKVRDGDVAGNVLGSVEGDLGMLPYADASFDAVISLGAPLSHMTRADARYTAVMEMARVVKPGHLCFLTGCMRLAVYRAAVFWMDMAFFDQMASPDARERGIFDGSQLWYMFAPGELDMLVSKAGLEIVARVGCEGLANYLPWEHLEQLEQDPDRWPVWREMLIETCEEETLLGLSSHVLVVARKPACGAATASERPEPPAVLVGRSPRGRDSARADSGPGLQKARGAASRPARGTGRQRHPGAGTASRPTEGM